MKLEKGMYVRTNKGIIDKILLVEYAEEKRQEYPNHPSKSYWRDKIFLSKERYWRTSQNIIKASHNILELIKVGDIINKKEVVNIVHFEGDAFYRIELFGGKAIMNSKDIKSIVTKEQFNTMKYEVSK